MARYREPPRTSTKIITDTMHRIDKLERVARFNYASSGGGSSSVAINDFRGGTILGDDAALGGLLHPRWGVNWSADTTPNKTCTNSTFVTVATAAIYMYHAQFTVKIACTCPGGLTGRLRLRDTDADSILDTTDFAATDNYYLDGYMKYAFIKAGLEVVDGVKTFIDPGAVDGVELTGVGYYFHAAVELALVGGSGTVQAKVIQWMLE